MESWANNNLVLVLAGVAVLTIAITGFFLAVIALAKPKRTSQPTQPTSQPPEEQRLPDLPRSPFAAEWSQLRVLNDHVRMFKQTSPQMMEQLQAAVSPEYTKGSAQFTADELNAMNNLQILVRDLELRWSARKGATKLHALTLDEIDAHVAVKKKHMLANGLYASEQEANERLKRYQMAAYLVADADWGVGMFKSGEGSNAEFESAVSKLLTNSQTNPEPGKTLLDVQTAELADLFKKTVVR